MAKKQTKAARGVDGRLVVRNLEEVGGRLPAGEFRLHLTRAQWAALVKGVKSTKGVPKRGGRLEFIPDPNGDGTARFVCNPGPGEECSVRVRPTPDGVTFECRCRVKEVPGGGGGGGGGGRVTLPPCILRLPKGGRAAECLRGSCRGKCELRLAKAGDRWVLFCVCG